MVLFVYTESLYHEGIPAMSSSKIQIKPSNQQELARLKVELHQARLAQLEAESELAQEQAEVNAFRMHCRLKLDELVEKYTELQAQKQACLIRLELLRQGDDLVWLEEDDLLNEESDQDADEQVEELILPTPTLHDKDVEKRLYRELARRFHPDLARTAVEQSYRTSMMTAVNHAYAANNLQALYDLAGELKPDEIAELAGIENREIHQLRMKIFKARRFQRRARHQLRLLRNENTARLWRRARTIEGQGQDWWSIVQLELRQAIEKRLLEVNELQQILDRLEEGQI